MNLEILCLYSGRRWLAGRNRLLAVWDTTPACKAERHAAKRGKGREDEYRKGLPPLVNHEPFETPQKRRAKGLKQVEWHDRPQVSELLAMTEDPDPDSEKPTLTEG